MGSIAIRLRHGVDKSDADEMILNALETLTRAFIENPNYHYSNKDWEVHYHAANEILNVYKMISSEVVNDSETLLFLMNIKTHITRLNEYRDLGTLTGI